MAMLLCDGHLGYTNELTFDGFDLADNDLSLRKRRVRYSHYGGWRVDVICVWWTSSNNFRREIEFEWVPSRAWEWDVPRLGLKDVAFRVRVIEQCAHNFLRALFISLLAISCTLIRSLWLIVDTYERDNYRNRNMTDADAEPVLTLKKPYKDE